jgi:hypothetical protein
MADEQDPPVDPREATPSPPASERKPPVKRSPAEAAKKAPAKATKKAAPAKKVPTKAAKGAKAAAKKVTPKKVAPAEPPKKAAPVQPPPPAAPQKVAETAPRPRADSDGQGLIGAASQAAVQAKQAVDTAGDSLASAITRVPGTESRIRMMVALAATLLAILLIRRLRGSED